VSDLAVIVFSKDRPLQLDATLRSLALNNDDIAPEDVHVLYMTSGPAFAAGYRILASEHPGVRLHRETHFKTDLVALVDGSRSLLFLVDDTLFVGPFSAAGALRVLDEDESCLGFSLRLGRNTTQCYTLDQPQSVPKLTQLHTGVLTFDWTKAEHDFGYPLEVSSSLYRTSDILPLLQRLDYRSPNTLEGALARHASSFREARPRLACFAQSVAFSVPANLVQTAWKNRADSNPALTARALADVYARGHRLDVEQYQGFVANAAHEVVDFDYTRRPDIPTVSVIIPCYGQAQYLPAAVASVVAQTFDDWELVVVDDGSPDDTAQVAERLINRHVGRRIRLLRGPNQGLSRARNTGIEAARGRYILPLDADDEVAPTMLESTVDVLERDPSIAAVYTDLQQFGEGDHLIRAADFNPNTLPDANHLSYCSLYRREVWEAVGGYNPNMKWGYEDWDFWLGVVEKGYQARRIPQPLFRYRIRATGMYAGAVEHDSELRRQMTVNHPMMYRRSERLKRRFRLQLRAIVARLRRGVRRGLAGRSGEGP
jgi:glycosyltransferase involved in cell wall biosynthesis